MKIGIFDPYLDDVGGGEKYMLSIAECLSARHNVRVFWDKEEDFILAKKRFGLKLEGVELVENIFEKNILAKLLATKEYDAIIFLSDGSIPFTLSKKLFLHIQRPIETRQTGIKGKLKMANVGGIFVNSGFTKNYIDRNLSINSKVIYPPVKIKYKSVRKENIILHVGRFRVTDKTAGGVKDYKKQSVMIELFKKLSKKLGTEWRFILAVSVKEDDKDKFNELKENAKGFPVEFVINKTNDELWELYSKAKIYWHASGFGEDLDKNPEYAEHFGISTVEAMGAGCVPVVINAGGQREIVEDNVSGLLWDSIDEFEEKTLRVVKDEKLMRKLSKNAIKKAKEYSSEKFCHKINGLIES